MPKPSATRFAVLGFLEMGPRTGYDIKQFVEDHLSHFWNESYRWIYTTLDQLEAEGLATARAEERGDRERVVYRITKKGERALRDWLAEPARQMKLRDEMLLKLLFSHGGAARLGIQQVKRHQGAMLERHDQIGALEQGLSSTDLDAATRQHLALALDLSRRVTAAHLRWCEETLKQLKSRRRAGPRRSKARSR